MGESVTDGAGSGARGEAALGGLRVGVIGCGAMGSAIARGLVEAGVLACAQLVVCDHDADKLVALEEACGVAGRASAAELLAERPDVVILAVKPQVLGELLAQSATALHGVLAVSIAAGVPLATLEAALPGSRVVRVMPNLPVSVRSGASAVAGGSSATEADVELVRSLFAVLGAAVVMREDQLDAEGAAVGCGPAYFALMVDALTSAAVRAGLPAASAREMLLATMAGTAQMLLASGEHPRAYMERVTSPGGTTASALRVLEPALMAGANEAVDAALARTAQLARG